MQRQRLGQGLANHSEAVSGYRCSKTDLRNVSVQLEPASQIVRVPAKAVLADLGLIALLRDYQAWPRAAADLH